MNKDEALNKIIEYCKNGSKTPVSDFCRIPCSVCPFNDDNCENVIADVLTERLIKAEEKADSLEETCYKLQQALEEKKETNLEHYYDSKLAFDKGVTDDIYTLCFKARTDEAYKKSGIYDFKRWLLSPYEEPKPKYKLSQFECDLLKTFVELSPAFSRNISMECCFTYMKEKGYFKDIPNDTPFQDILDNCEMSIKVAIK